GAQLIANCRIDELLLENLPHEGRDGRTHRVTGVVGWLTDSRGRDRERVEIRARRVVLAGGPFSSPRILMRSRVPAIRASKGSQRAVGTRFSTHGTVTMYGDFDEPIYPSAGTPPMGDFVKKYEVDGQAEADPPPRHLRPLLVGW